MGNGESITKRRTGESGKEEKETENRGIGESENWEMAERINSYRDLRVYQSAMDAAMRIFQLTKLFPAEEKYSLVDQMRRSSRSVCANIAEA